MLSLKTALLLVVLFNTNVQAAVYKCIDDDGVTAYSQLPCPPKVTTNDIAPEQVKKNAELCAIVNEFAVDMATRMLAGQTVEQEIASLGGNAQLSEGTLAIINDVYAYSRDSAVTATRIGSLTQAKCDNGAFGEIQKTHLPRDYFSDTESNAALPKRKALHDLCAT